MLLRRRQQGLAQGIPSPELLLELGVGALVIVVDRDFRDLEELVAVVSEGADIDGLVTRSDRDLEPAGKIGLVHLPAADVQEQHAAQDEKRLALAADEEVLPQYRLDPPAEVGKRGLALQHPIALIRDQEDLVLVAARAH